MENKITLKIFNKGILLTSCGMREYFFRNQKPGKKINGEK